MDAIALTLVAGTVLSLVFSYVPRADGSFKKLSGVAKRLIMLLCLVTVTGVIYGLSCIGWGAEWGIAVTCDQPGFTSLSAQFILALIANQSTYAISPQKIAK